MSTTFRLQSAAARAFLPKENRGDKVGDSAAAAAAWTAAAAAAAAATLQLGRVGRVVCQVDVLKVVCGHNSQNALSCTHTTQ